MGAVTLVVLTLLSAVNISEPDRARLEPVRKALAAWRARASTCDLYYSLDTLWMPAAARRHSVWASISQPLATTTEVRVARSGDKRRYSSSGEIMADGRVVRQNREQAFDGHETIRKRGSTDVTRRRGRNDAAGHIQPTTLVGIDSLCHDLLDHADPTLARITTQPKEDGKLEITLHFQAVQGSMKYVYLVKADQPYVVERLTVSGGPSDAVVMAVYDVKYTRLANGILFPVSGTRTDYDSSSGEPWTQVTFKLDVEKSRVDPPGGLPDEVFRLEIPAGVTVVDLGESEVGAARRQPWERRTELPGTRPATQPTTQPGATGSR